MSLRKISPGPLLLFILLTGVTQVGGLAYLAARWIAGSAARRFQFGWLRQWCLSVVGFCGLYLAVSILVLPPVATAVGRPPLPCSVQSDRIVAPLNRLVCVLNRHYASPPVHDLLDALSKHMNEKHPGTVVAYLDASFPLIDDFPLLPHLSHDDGHKIDLAFFYRDQQGRYQPGSALSPLGYWGFEEPRQGDPVPCANRNDIVTLRWNMKLFSRFLASARLDAVRTEAMLHWLAANAKELSVEKILLEPHLKARFGLKQQVVRFQGCRAVRHDDHVHIAMKRSSSRSKALRQAFPLASVRPVLPW